MQFKSADKAIKQKNLSFKSQAAMIEFIKKYAGQQQQKGYVSFSVDSIYCSNDSCIAQLYFGNKYKKNDNSIYNLKQTIETQLINLENNGYPFASIAIDSIIWDSTSINYQLSIDTGRYILIDSLTNLGNAKIHLNYLQNYLNIKRNKPYNESKIKSIDELLYKLPYVNINQPTKILFKEDKANVYFSLDKRKVNKFDFIVGFLPNYNNTGKFLVTGEARIDLKNAFKRGEEIFLEWVRLRPNSQRLNIKFNYPFLLNTPLGIHSDFKLDKRDSTALDLIFNVGLPYYTKTNNYIKGYYNFAQTIMLQMDTLVAKSQKKLPNNLDASYNLYGIEAYFENLDYLFNPKKGFELKLNAAIGTKKIKPNIQLTALSDGSGFNYETIYDSVRLKSIKSNFAWLANYFVGIGKRSVIKLSNSGSAIFNQQLLKNELLRIGGNKILRGFDEESILASQYVLTTVEYRLLLSKNSYFFNFIDFAFVRTNFDAQKINNFPFGFGAGINFETKIGIFGLTYALGRQNQQAISFRNSKLHFGYVALF